MLALSGTRTADRDRLEERLQKILSLALPPGQLLDETTLAERFDMPRSPGREALIRLGADELGVTLTNRSTIVAPIEVANFPKYVEALDRSAHEYPACLRAQDRGRPEDHRQAAEIRRSRGQERQLPGHVGGQQGIPHVGRLCRKHPISRHLLQKLLSQGKRMLHLHFEYLGRTNEAIF